MFISIDLATISFLFLLRLRYMYINHGYYTKPILFVGVINYCKKNLLTLKSQVFGCSQGRLGETLL